MTYINSGSWEVTMRNVETYMMLYQITKRYWFFVDAIWGAPHCWIFSTTAKEIIFYLSRECEVVVCIECNAILQPRQADVRQHLSIELSWLAVQENNIQCNKCSLLISWRIFFFFQRGHVKLIKRDSKEFFF